jgi:hypothetical protein
MSSGKKSFGSQFAGVRSGFARYGSNGSSHPALAYPQRFGNPSTNRS